MQAHNVSFTDSPVKKKEKKGFFGPYIILSNIAPLFVILLVSSCIQT